MEWTEQEDRILISNANRLSAKQLAKMMTRTTGAIYQRAHVLRSNGYTVSMAKTDESSHLTSHSDDLVELCRQLDDEGLGKKDIAEKLGVPYSTVTCWCRYDKRV